MFCAITHVYNYFSRFLEFSVRTSAIFFQVFILAKLKPKKSILNSMELFLGNKDSFVFKPIACE